MYDLQLFYNRRRNSGEYLAFFSKNMGKTILSNLLIY